MTVAGSMKRLIPKIARLAYDLRYNSPVLIREIRTRYRGDRPFSTLFLYVFVMCAVGMGALIVTWDGGFFNPGSSPGRDTSEMGMALFYAVAVVQVLMIDLVVPALSAGLISTERDKGTFILLALTPITSKGIVFQKWLAVLAQVGILVITCIPVMSVAFLIGGVSPWEMLVALAVLGLRACFDSSVGLFMSSRCGNTRAASFATYGVVLFLGGFCSPCPLTGILSPMVLLMPVMMGGSSGFGSSMYMYWPWLIPLFWLAATVVLLALTIARVKALRRT